MTKEDALAYEVNPHTLETIGPWTYGGKLRSPTMTAHPRIDPVTGEMFMFGYEAGGLATDDVAYFIADRDGNLKSEQWFKAPYCSLMHDFGLTQNWAVFPVFPTKSDLARLKAGGVHWTHDQQGDSWVGIMPRYGGESALVQGAEGHLRLPLRERLRARWPGAPRCVSRPTRSRSRSSAQLPASPRSAQPCGSPRSAGRSTCEAGRQLRRARPLPARRPAPPARCRPGPPVLAFLAAEHGSPGARR